MREVLISDIEDIKVKQKAITNRQNNLVEGFIETRELSMNTTLLEAFVWRKSPEGFEYWNKIEIELKYKINH